MKGPRVLAIVAAATIASAVPATSGANPNVVRGCKAAPGTRIAVSGSHRFALRVGKQEKMYTRAQVKRLHPKSGEVMLRGGMSGMNMGGPMRHLEVQICNRATGAVVTNASPKIFVFDATAANAIPMQIPVAVMEGVGKGVADLHYGNNVSMAAGHKFTIRVRLNSEHVTFDLTAPKT